MDIYILALMIIHQKQQTIIPRQLIILYNVTYNIQMLLGII